MAKEVFSYTTKGVCSRNISITVENGLVEKVVFEGGCNGNAQGLCKLVVGMKADEVIQKLKGIECGYKGTSCPDQLAKGLETMLKEKCS